MLNLNKAMLWVVTVFAIAFLFFPNYVGSILGAQRNQVTDDMEQVVFSIGNMTCEGCAITVATAIRKVPGIIAVDIHYEKREAVVGMERGPYVPRA